MDGDSKGGFKRKWYTKLVKFCNRLEKVEKRKKLWARTAYSINI